MFPTTKTTTPTRKFPRTERKKTTKPSGLSGARKNTAVPSDKRIVEQKGISVPSSSIVTRNEKRKPRGSSPLPAKTRVAHTSHAEILSLKKTVDSITVRPAIPVTKKATLVIEEYRKRRTVAEAKVIPPAVNL